MKDPRSISIADYTYDLPADRIAAYPLAQRDQSKLLVYDNGRISDHVFSALPDLLPPNALIVFNNTKVIHARMRFQKESGGAVEIFCLEPVDEYQTAMQARKAVRWHCMIGGVNKWKEGSLRKQLLFGQSTAMLSATRMAESAGGHLIEFSWNNADYSFAEILSVAGDVPLPPYIKRAADAADDGNYQTVFAKHEGSVAAPTASLHFTDDVLQRIAEKGIKKAEVTLHVGAGTFKPVKSETLGDHDMHGEWISVSKDTMQALIDHQGPVIASGTTALRTLETLYWLGVKAMRSEDTSTLGQWESYEQKNDQPVSKLQSLSSLLSLYSKNQITFLTARTSILIAPGYNFQMADFLITNFHQPNSTLLLLIAAAAGEDWKKIYTHALEHGYRFLSYGDASVLKIRAGS